MLLASHSQGAEAPRGKSKQLGFSFEVQGDASWCGTIVQVKLTADDSSAFTKNFEKFQQALGRIRAIVTSECPKARAIDYSSEAAGLPYSTGESAKVTNWVYVPFETAGAAAVCKGPPDEATCAQRWSMFNFARALFRQEGFDRVQLTRYLSSEPGADVEFTNGKGDKVIGRMTFVDGQQNPLPFSNSTEFVDAQFADVMDACDDGTVKSYPSVDASEVSYRGLDCTKAGRPQSRHFIIGQDGGNFTVIGIAGSKRDGLEARKLADAVLSAYPDAP